MCAVAHCNHGNEMTTPSLLQRHPSLHFPCCSFSHCLHVASSLLSPSSRSLSTVLSLYCLKKTKLSPMISLSSVSCSTSFPPRKGIYSFSCVFRSASSIFPRSSSMQCRLIPHGSCGQVTQDPSSFSTLLAWDISRLSVFPRFAVTLRSCHKTSTPYHKMLRAQMVTTR